MKRAKDIIIEHVELCKKIDEDKCFRRDDWLRRNCGKFRK